MDFSTFIGIFGALALMVIAILQGGSIMMFINIQSIIIVCGGTIGVTLVHYPFSEALSVFKIISKTFFSNKISAEDTIKQMVFFSTKARKEGVLSLQNAMDNLSDKFLVSGLQMAVDGIQPEAVRASMEKDIIYTTDRHEFGAEIFATMGAYAPALGMIGTLIGLVQMLQTMSDPSSIGPAMAVALLTTFYGAVIANIICIPLSGKLKSRAREEALCKELILEGVMSIVHGENPRLMEQKLLAFLSPKDRDIGSER